nr:choice-of-anchor L domain-containing protein [uncultured Chryseobacterium sp.]
MKFKNNKYIEKHLLMFLTLLAGSVFSQVTYTSNPTNAQIHTSVIGNNIIVSGGTLNHGVRNTQIATFNNGIAAGLEMGSGVFFGTGLNANLLTVNTNTVTSDAPGGGVVFNDPDLQTVDAFAVNDVVSYSFSVTIGPKASTLNIRYQFGSEEYPDFVGSKYDDAFGFFVTGPGITGTANLARLPANNNPTSINKVNFGVPGVYTDNPFSPAYDGSQNALYINNGHPTTVSGGKLVANDNLGPKPVAVQFNAITKLITYTLGGLTPGATYTFKIIIADTADTQYDSGVFVNTIYATATLVANNDAFNLVSGSTTTISVLNNDTVNNVSPASLSDVLLTQVSTTNNGVNLNPTTGLITAAPGTPAGVYNVTYQICDQTFTSNCKTAVATITVVANDTDGDGIDNYFDLDDDNDGILDTAEGCSATVTMGTLTSGTVTSLNNTGTAVFPLVPPGATLPNNGVRVTRTSGANTWGSFTPPVATATTTVHGVTTSSFPTTYLDLIGTIPRTLTIDFGTSANALSTSSNTYQYIIGIAGLGGENASVTNTFSVPLTVAGNANVFNTNLYSLLNGVAAAPGATGTVFSTNTPLTTVQGYTFFLVPSNVASLTMTLTGGNDPHGIIFGVYNANCNADTDGDTVSNYLDVDSDNDGCADALEGSENVRIAQIHALSLPTSDANYANRGQIKVLADGVTAGTPVQVVSTAAAANGVPLLVNNAANNTGGVAGVADNTDGTADAGQGIGTAQNSGVQDSDCTRCFRPATSPGTGGLTTTHGITALSRAGATTGNWPMKITGAYSALDAKSKGFVINRLTTTQLNALATPVVGMMVYDTTVNCLKIYDNTNTWRCFSNPTCDTIILN